MKRPCFIFIILLLFSASLYPQESNTPDEDFTDHGYSINGSYFYYDFYLFQPGAFIFYDLNDEETSESYVDFFTNGNANFSLDLVGLQLYYKIDDLDLGSLLGLGISTAENSKNEILGAFTIISGGLYASYKKAIKLQVGYILGISAIENLKKNTDAAVYVGFAFPTKAEEVIKKR